uniref:ISXO2-like transposase domain-containing protein n=1 Tax=Octopus bimaculoides TaxID=37653 RepID=A0A0L8I778_OCTBM
MPPLELTNGVKKRTVIYKTLKVSTKKIEMASIEDIEKCLKEVKKATTFITRGRRYVTVEVRFASEDEAIKHSTDAIKTGCCNYLLRNPYQIGGLGHIVELDESMMCKRKYNRNRMPLERWVIGGWDREDKNGFLVFVPDRSSETLLPLIKKFIKPGTTIYSDCWSAYNGITEIDVTQKYTHFKVNHSENFVDPITNVHTNSVECYWKNVKRRFKSKMEVHTDMVESYLDEFFW